MKRQLGAGSIFTRLGDVRKGVNQARIRIN